MTTSTIKEMPLTLSAVSQVEPFQGDEWFAGIDTHARTIPVRFSTGQRKTFAAAARAYCLSAQDSFTANLWLNVSAAPDHLPPGTDEVYVLSDDVFAKAVKILKAGYKKP